MKPKGGRGKTLPYEQTHIRIPIPLKQKVQSIIDEYRYMVAQFGVDEAADKTLSEDLKVCLKLVNIFIEERGISEASLDKPTRDNQNLKRFQEWIEQQLSESAAK